MRRLRVFVMVVLALSLPRMAQAHFVWIEAEPVGKPDAPVAISLFYGEPHELLREESPGNLDRHAGRQAWVVDPSGEWASLALRKEKNRFVTSFQPTRVGRHTIIASSTDVAPVNLTTYGKGTMRAVFFARSQFLAFEPGRLSERDRELGGLLEYDIVPVTRGIDPRAGTLAFLHGHELLVRFTTKTQPTARVRLQAQGPHGWIKEMRPSDSWGVTSFVPLWPGRYVISRERDEPSLGELQGRKYDTISQRVTFSFLVEASR
jgi:hypothetical protein